MSGIDYTEKDGPALERRIKRYVKGSFPDWTDTDRANFGNMVNGAVAGVGDVVTYYLDAAANEAFATRVTQRKNALAHARAHRYAVASATAARALVTFSIPAAVAGDVTFPAGTAPRTAEVSSPASFQLLEALTIAAGQTSASAWCENSVSREQRITSTGLPDQEARLGSTPYLDGTLSVSAANGDYTIVSNLLDSTSTDRHCTVEVDQNDAALVRFGDGTLGAIPTGTIVFTYRTWGGYVGELPPAAIQRVEGTFADSFGTTVRVTVTNAEASTTGAARESVARIRARIPAASRENKTAVCREDYETGALAVPGVARALCLTRYEDPALAENAGRIYLVTPTGAAASSTLRTTVLAQFRTVSGYPTPPYRALQTFQLDVVSSNFLTVDILVTAFKRAGYTAAQMKANILAAVRVFFAILLDDTGAVTTDWSEGVPNAGIDFGYYLKDVDGNPTDLLARSDIQGVIAGAAGVLRIGSAIGDLTLNGAATGDVPLEKHEFPKLGTLTVIDGDTGLEA